jgi:hypothetical protein
MYGGPKALQYRRQSKIYVTANCGEKQIEGKK